MAGSSLTLDSHTGSPRYLISNRDRLAGGLPPPDSEIPSGRIEDYQWLIGTHHRDFDDQEVYKDDQSLYHASEQMSIHCCGSCVAY